ncbi:MAG: cysteine desulfurase [Defluviitaleaceae bacterium]|nr:cysteine desulfurase [Defluviitaleaceae bacterium]
MIYLDNGATTKPHKEVIQLLSQAMEQSFFNPSSLHGGGLLMEKKLKWAKETFFDLLGQRGDFYFTSGGTESNNLAILGSLGAKKHIITTKAEHPSVLRVVELQKSRGYKVDYVETDKYGTVCPDSLKELLTSQTGIVSIMDTNNELGTTQDINALGNIIKSHSNAIFHVDAVASFGKRQLALSNVDVLTISAHKIHGPQGIGGIFIKPKVRIKPIFFGGSQQKKIRPGTEFTTGALAFVLAAQLAYIRMEKNFPHVQALRNKIAQLPIKNMVVNTPANALPYILNISFLGAKGQVIVNALSAQEIYTSTGAACNERSHNILKTLGHSQEVYEGAIRISFSQYNTMDEIEVVSEALTKVSNLF